MAISAGNLTTGISIKLQSRFLLVPLVKKASLIIWCRAYGSSGPVRYIPKKSSKRTGTYDSWSKRESHGKEFNNRSDSSSLSSKVLQKGNDTRRMLGVDENYLINDLTCASRNFDVAADNNALEKPEEDVEKFKISQGKDLCEQDAIQSSKTKRDAENFAIQALASRAFTAVQLRKKLHGKKVRPDIIEELIKEFQNRGLINDYLYAEAFSRSRWSSLSWGPRRIKQALVQKGVSEMEVGKAIRTVFEDDDSDGNQESSIGMSKLSIDHLFVQASKQWLRGQGVPYETRKSRIIRWLQYRGFNWGVTSLILKKLETQCPT